MKCYQLIIVSGYPASGKTYRSSQIATCFIAKSLSKPQYSSLKVHHITDTTLSIPRTVYDLSSHSSHERSNNSSEKDARALVYASVKRLLTKNDVVIVDAAAGNYIKGWRYQLFCEAKALRTPCCVVHVGTPIETARNINEERLKKRDAGEAGFKSGDVEGAYERETWENLVYRYEEPNGMVKWDSPLFTVGYEDVEPPNEDIWTYLVGDEKEGGKGKTVVRPNAATVQKPMIQEGYLYELDRITMEVVKRISDWVKDHIGEGGGEIDVGDGETIELPAEGIMLPALQRHRRQFISMQRVNPVLKVDRMKGNFVRYLNDNFHGV